LDASDASPTSTPATSRPSLRGLLPVVLLSRTTLNSGSRIVYPFLPAIARGLGMSVAGASVLLTVRFAAGLAAPFLGPLADRYGRRRLMEAGLVLFSLAGFLLAGVGTLPAAGVAFALYGLSKVLYDPALLAYLGDSIPYAERGRAIGLSELAWSAAWLVGVPATGFLMERFGWRAPWSVLATLALVGAALTHVSIPGMATPGGGSAAGLMRSTVGLWRELFRRPAVAALLGTSVLMILAIEIPFIVYGAWLEQSFGLSLTNLGLASTVVGLAEAAAELATVGFTDRLGKRHSALLGLLLLAASLLALPLLAGLGLLGALVGVALMMFAFEFGVVSMIPLVTEVAPDGRAAAISLNTTAVSLGRILGGAFGGWLWGWGMMGINSAVGAGCALAAALVLWRGMPGER
jgi:predicted MFS family arabinose efflux permease